VIRAVANAFHNGSAVARVVAIAKGFRQGLCVDHYGVVGVIRVNRYLRWQHNIFSELLSLHHHHHHL